MKQLFLFILIVASSCNHLHAENSFWDKLKGFAGYLMGDSPTAETDMMKSDLEKLLHELETIPETDQQRDHIVDVLRELSGTYQIGFDELWQRMGDGVHEISIDVLGDLYSAVKGSISSSWSLQYLLARELKSRGVEHHIAYEIFRSLEKQDLNNIDFLVAKGIYFFDKRNFKSSAYYYERAGRTKNNPLYSMALFVTQLQENKVEEAGKTLEELRLLLPAGGIHGFNALYQAFKFKLDEATSALRVALKLNAFSKVQLDAALSLEHFLADEDLKVGLIEFTSLSQELDNPNLSFFFDRIVEKLNSRSLDFWTDLLDAYPWSHFAKYLMIQKIRNLGEKQYGQDILDEIMADKNEGLELNCVQNTLGYKKQKGESETFFPKLFDECEQALRYQMGKVNELDQLMQHFQNLPVYLKPFEALYKAAGRLIQAVYEEDVAAFAVAFQETERLYRMSWLPQEGEWLIGEDLRVRIMSAMEEADPFFLYRIYLASLKGSKLPKDIINYAFEKAISKGMLISDVNEWPYPGDKGNSDELIGQKLETLHLNQARWYAVQRRYEEALQLYDTLPEKPWDASYIKLLYMASQGKGVDEKTEKNILDSVLEYKEMIRDLNFNLHDERGISAYFEFWSFRNEKYVEFMDQTLRILESRVPDKAWSAKLSLSLPLLRMGRSIDSILTLLELQEEEGPSEETGKSPEYYLARCLWFFYRGEFKPAMDAIKRLPDYLIHPEYYKIRFSEELLKEEPDPAALRADLEKVIEMRPGNSNSGLRVELYHRVGYFEKSAMIFDYARDKSELRDFSSEELFSGLLNLALMNRLDGYLSSDAFLGVYVDPWFVQLQLLRKVKGILPYLRTLRGAFFQLTDEEFYFHAVKYYKPQLEQQIEGMTEEEKKIILPLISSN
jgi:hypothetical protein